MGTSFSCRFQNQDIILANSYPINDYGLDTCYRCQSFFHENESIITCLSCDTYFCRNCDASKRLTINGYCKCIRCDTVGLICSDRFKTQVGIVRQQYIHLS